MKISKHTFLSFILFGALSITILSCDDDDTTVPPASSSFSYLALGDSYTIGQCVEVEDRFANQLYDRLETDGILIDPFYMVAQSGWTTQNLSSTMGQVGIANDSFTVVSLLIGVNNQFQGLSITAYEAEFEDLLNQAISLAKGNADKVFVLSIPDYGYTPQGLLRGGPAAISPEIDAFNAVNKRITEQSNVTYFDITTISRRGLDERNLICQDSLHPSAEMHSLWLDVFYDDVKAMFEN